MVTLLNLASYLIPIIFFLAFSLKKAGWELWVIFFYVLLSLATDILIMRSNFGQQHSNQFIGLFTICEFTIFAAFFIASITKKPLRRIVQIVSILVLLFLVYSYFNSSNEKFDSIAGSTESVTLIAFSVVFLFGEINKPLPYDMYASPNFWIILAILIYMASTLFLFIIASDLTDQEKGKYWIINSISSIISNVIFGIGFFKGRKLGQNSIFEKSSFEYHDIPENHRKLEP